MSRKVLGEDQRYLVLDYETRSRADLKLVGAHEYAAHESTLIMCACWRVGTRKQLATAQIKRWDMRRPLNPALIELLEDPDIIVVAHNAFFEQVITHFVLGVKVPIKRWLCTATLAAASGFPRALDGASMAMGLTHKKDKVGHKLMLKWCKPRKPTKRDKSEWCADPEELDKIVDYCAKDIAAETEVFLRLPPLSDAERELWLLDQKINWRGFRADLKLVDRCLAMIETELCNLNQETLSLTLGVVDSATKVAQLQRWMASGVSLPNMRAKTVGDFLKRDDLDPESRRLLEIRQSASKTSTKKFLAFKNRSSLVDARCRDTLVFHGAGTGRWTASGIQPQNLPRGTLSDPVEATELIRKGDLEMVRLIYGDPMLAMSSIIRSAIVAGPERVFFCADYAAIEARVLFWVAHHEAGLEAFRNGEDLYKDMAADIYGMPVEQISKDLHRPLGKEAILGCGFGMGDARFYVACNEKGVPVSAQLAKIAVETYRKKHRPVPLLWRDVERAALNAVRSPGCVFKAGRCHWYVRSPGAPLVCRLPSGRLMRYQYPFIRYKVKWDRKRPELNFYGVNPKTRQWMPESTWGGSLVENLVQAIARDTVAAAMIRVEKARYPVVLSVHDEILAERLKNSGGSLEEFIDIIEEKPPWLDGCPIKASGWLGKRYRK